MFTDDHRLCGGEFCVLADNYRLLRDSDIVFVFVFVIFL